MAGQCGSRATLSAVGERGFAHVPALDGLRAVAVAAVLAFHSGFGWASGGFLGVSLFFTLSGFLITSLLLDEHTRRGRVALAAFFARRARRLLPAALLCVAFVLAVAVWWGPGQREHLPGDAVSALLGVANWRFLAGEAAYQDLFVGGPSPLAHFWSLSIEQQCYVVLPLVVVAALRGGRRVAFAVLVGLLSLAVIATWITSDPDTVYQGTHTRAAELLAGAVVAVWLAGRSSRRVQRANHVDGGSSVVPEWVAGVGLTVFVAAVVGTGLRTDWLYRGGLAGAGVVWAALIAGLLGGASRFGVTKLLGWAPLVWVGRVSYGIYLFHWPVFLLITPARLGTDGPALHLVRYGFTAVLVAASFVMVEEPIRRRRVLTGWRFATLAPFATALLVLMAAVAVPAPNYSRTEQLLAAGDDGPLVFEAPSTPGASSAQVTSTPAPPPVALAVGGGARPVEELEAAGFEVIEGPQPGCALVPGVELQLPDGREVPAGECMPAVRAWRDLRDKQFDVVVIAVADLDAAVVRFAGDEGFPADEPAERARRAQRVEDGIRAAIASLVESQMPVVVLDESTDGAAGERLRKAAVRLGVDLHLTTSAIDAASTARDLVGRSSSDTPVVLVLGDSTSLDLAQALHDGADGRLRVVWAGANGCPFAAVEATRPSSDREWTDATCPDRTEVLPPLLATHAPDLVLVVSGPTELGEHRYPGSSEAAVAGDQASARAQDAALAQLVALVGPTTPVVFATAPPITAGGWASDEMADPGRLAAWNAAIDRLAAAPGDSVVTWPYATALADYEAAHGNIRHDGVHPDVDALTELARTRLVDELLAFLPSR